MKREVGGVVWLTGLSGSGKTTLAKGVLEKLQPVRSVELLDGDEMRANLCIKLGFSRADRDTNVMRIGYVARLLARHGVLVIVAAISPYADARADVARLCTVERIPFIEVFVDAPLAVVKERDPKGLYRRALNGEIEHFTGISDPYERPCAPALHLQTAELSATVCTDRLLRLLSEHGLAPDYPQVIS